jgi:hypothetical protein
MVTSFHPSVWQKHTEKGGKGMSWNRVSKSYIYPLVKAKVPYIAASISAYQFSTPAI